MNHYVISSVLLIFRHYRYMDEKRSTMKNGMLLAASIKQPIV